MLIRDLDQEEEARFFELAREYEWQTMIMSSTSRMRCTPAFWQLWQMGPKIIPNVLNLMAEGHYGMNWQALLTDLTGEQPTSEAMDSVGAGFVGIRVKDAAELWVRWGRERKLTSAEGVREEGERDQFDFKGLDASFEMRESAPWEEKVEEAQEMHSQVKRELAQNLSP